MSQELEGSLSGWKRVALKAFFGGPGLGLAILAVGLFLSFYKPPATSSWNIRALKVKRVKAEGLDRHNDKFEQVSVGTMFTLDLENTTDADITLPQNIRVMQETKKTGALHGSSVKLDSEYFIPAQHLVSVTLSNDDLCAAKVKEKNCFETYFRDEEAIVLFDNNQKYEIRAAIPAFSPPQ